MQQLPYRATAVAAVFGAAILGAACSDDPAAALTRDEWIEQADAVCASTEEQFADAYDGIGEEPTPPEIEGLFDAVLAAVSDQIDGIAELAPPSELEPDVDAFLDEALAALTEARALDPQEAYAAEASPFDRALGLANDLGVTACGEPSRSVELAYPYDGAEVASPVALTMAATGFVVEPAGEVRDGAGHLHVMVDVPCVEPGEVIPRDEAHVHFGDGQTGTSLDLEPGTHTLCLQAADGAHTALDLTDELTIEVVG